MGADEINTAQIEAIVAGVVALRSDARLPKAPSPEQVIDWAHGNAAIENADVTREIVEAAARGGKAVR